jgi:hypothetical protein
LTGSRSGTRKNYDTVFPRAELGNKKLLKKKKKGGKRKITENEFSFL